MATGSLVGLDPTFEEVRAAVGEDLDRQPRASGATVAWRAFEFEVDGSASGGADVSAASAPAPAVGAAPSAASTQPPAGGFLIGNVLRIVEYLALGPRSAPELATLLQVDPRSCRRVLNRLVAEGYVEHDGRHRRRYRLAFRASSVAAQVLHGSPLPMLASRRLEDVASPGSTAHLWAASPGGPPLSIVRVTETANGRQTDFQPAPAAGEDTPASRVLEYSSELPTLRSMGDQIASVAAADYRRCPRSTCVVRLDDGLATVAAAVLQRSRVAAAVGVTNATGTRAALAVVRAAQDLTAALNRFAAAA